MTKMDNPPQSQVKQGAVIGGWICFALGVLVMYASVWAFLLYVPLFFVSFILSIIALAQKRIVSGMVLLLCCIVVPIVLWLILSFTRAAKFMDEHPPPPLRQGSTQQAAPVPFSNPPSTGAGSISSSSTAVPGVNRAEMIAKIHGEDISSVDAHRLQISFQTIVDQQASGQFGPLFSEDGKLLIYGRHETQGISIVIASLDTLEAVQVIRTEQEPRGAALSPDAVRLAYVTRDNHIRIKEIAAGKEIELPVNAYGGPIRWPREGEILFGNMALNLDDLRYNQIDPTRYTNQGVRYKVMYGSPGLGSENWGFHVMNNDGSYGHLLFNYSLPAIGACWNVSLDQRHFCFLNAGLGVGPLTICYLGLRQPLEQHITVKRSEIQGLPGSVAEFLRRPPGQSSETWPIYGGQINPLNHKIIGHNTSDFRGLGSLKHEPGEEWPVKIAYDKLPVREGDVLQLESTWWIWAPVHVVEEASDRFGSSSQAVSDTSSQSTSQESNGVPIPASSVGVSANSPGQGVVANPSRFKEEFDAVFSFIESWTRDLSNSDVFRIASQYTDPTDYYDEGTLSQSRLKDSLRGFYSRWPNQHITLATKPRIVKLREGNWGSTFVINFDDSSPRAGRRSRGQAEVTLEIKRDSDGELRITTSRERVLRREKN